MRHVVTNRDDFHEFLAKYPPGDSVIYHEGHLTYDRMKDVETDYLATAVLQAAGYRRVLEQNIPVIREVGVPRCVLVQKKLGPQVFQYIAIKR